MRKLWAVLTDSTQYIRAQVAALALGSDGREIFAIGVLVAQLRNEGHALGLPDWRIDQVISNYLTDIAARPELFDASKVRDELRKAAVE